MTAHSSVIRAPIGPELALQLNAHRGKWVAIVSDRIYAAGDSAVEVAQATPDHLDPLIYRVPRQSLARFLGIGESGPTA